MQNLRIVFKHPETGIICVTTPHPESDIMDVIKKDLPAGAQDVEVMQANDLPPIQLHGAWVKSPGKVTVHMDKARAIHLDTIRAARNQKLNETDAHYVKAHDIGNPDELAKIQAHRKALRDLPETIDLKAAETADDLLKIWPEILK